jgi:SAM-dependent methyltransferase
VDRPYWRFELVSRPEIPEADGTADWVTFFSVLTHLSPRDSYRYLREARRVLRRGGTIVFSVLELDLHGKLFEDYLRVADEAPGEPGGIRVDFLDRETIRTFAEHLDLEVAEFFRGNQRFIWLRSPEPILLSGGRQMQSPAAFGQSVGVLRVPTA